MSTGLDAIDDKIRALKDFKANADKYAMDAFVENSHIVLDMNFDEQLYMEGVNSDNIPIMSYDPYTPATEFIKKEKNQPYDRVTLRDTGDFHSDGYVDRISDTEAEIKSDDVKSYSLQKRYGTGILGLTDENMNEITEHYIKPDLIEKLRNGL